MNFIPKALDLWMAGCMIFVFAALGEFVVVKVLDVQYQYQINRVPKVLPMVNAKTMNLFCFDVYQQMKNIKILFSIVTKKRKIQSILENQCNGKRSMYNSCYMGEWKCSIEKSNTNNSNNTWTGK